ncbi:DUF6233 domain-containing protein [Streptomyces agglomeratus]|uniref:DUF6233 domain-containing protein n=1 Tax=Streptomyces agglomeratus TaxID=285458 RepID=UPI003F738418
MAHRGTTREPTRQRASPGPEPHRALAQGRLRLSAPEYRTPEVLPLHQLDGGVEAAEYRVWVRAPDHVRPVDGVDYDQVATEHLPPAPTSVVREVLGERRPSGWVLAKVREGRGTARGVLHAPDCEEAPQGAPLLGVEQALNVAENPGTRLCTLCGCAQELTPMLSGFDHITDS